MMAAKGGFRLFPRTTLRRRLSAFRPHRPPYARPSDSKRIALSVALSKGTLEQKRQLTEIKQYL